MAGAPTSSGNNVIVGLTGVNNKQYVTVALTNVSSVDGGSGNARIGFLLGDVNQNRVVAVSDVLLVNNQVAHLVTSANFLKDVNANGLLAVSDELIANNNVTKALPPREGAPPFSRRGWSYAQRIAIHDFDGGLQDLQVRVVFECLCCGFVRLRLHDQTQHDVVSHAAGVGGTRKQPGRSGHNDGRLPKF